MKLNQNKITVLLLGFLFLTFFFIYRNVFLKGEVILPGDIPYNTPLWQGESPESEYYKAGNYLLSDQINQFYVWHRMARKSILTKGTFPLWNPFIFAGQPLVANSQSAFFYPPNLLLFFFDPGTVATVRAFFNLLILIIFGFLAGRTLGISRNGSIMIAAAFALSGPVTVWLGHPHANVFSWFPFLIWSGDKLVCSGRKFFWTGIFGLGAGMSILGGHPETVFHLLLVVSIFLFVRILIKGKNEKGGGRALVFLVLALIAGLMIGAVQWIPFSDYLFQSATLQHGGRGGHDGFPLWSGQALPKVTGIATLVFPDFFGNPPDRTYKNPLDPQTNYNEQSAYFGLIPLAFFLFVLFRRGSPLWVMILSLLSLFSLGIAWRLPLFEVFNHIPVFSIVANGRLTIFFAFTAILLSGRGFDLFLEKIRSDDLKNRDIVRLTAVPVTAISVFFLFSMIRSIIQLVSDPSRWTSGDVSFFEYLVARIFSVENPGIMVTVFTSLAVLMLVFLLIKGKINPYTFGAVVVLVCIIDLAVPAAGYNPTIRNGDILPKPSVWKGMEPSTGPFRIISDGSMMIQNYNCVHGIHLMGGYDLPVFGRYGELFLSQNGKTDIHNHIWGHRAELIDFLNVRYYFSKGEKTALSGKYRLLSDNLNYRIYENTRAFPRAFMVYDYKVIRDSSEGMEWLKENDFRLRDRVLLEKEPGTRFSRAASSSDIENTVSIVHYSTDTVEIDVGTESGGILVMSDILMPGWKVTVDGNPGEILRANHTFRGVFVPTGTHRIVFQYKPGSVKTGAIITLSGLFLFLLFTLSGLVRKGRKTRPGPLDNSLKT